MTAHDAIAFIGGGHMARCLIGGLLRQGMPAAAIRVAEPYAPQREALERELGVRAFADNRAAAHGASTWVLAVKPPVVQGVCRELAPLRTPDTLLLSIAAGIRVAAIARWSGSPHGIVRCMPNLPALLGAGVTGIFAGAQTTQAQRDRAAAILAGVGSTVCVHDEEQLDAVTAVSGSGPAYLFLLAEAMERAADELGLPAEAARLLVRQTLSGSARMVAESADSPAQLRRQVTSPGGTTEAAVAALLSDRFPELVGKAMREATSRSAELSRVWESQPA